MRFKFEKLLICQKAIDFGEEMSHLARSFPKHEIYNRSSQISGGVDSLALNISEGSSGQTNAEFRKFMGYSLGSLAEVITCLHKENEYSMFLKKNSISSMIVHFNS